MDYSKCGLTVSLIIGSKVRIHILRKDFWGSSSDLASTWWQILTNYTARPSKKLTLGEQADN